MGIVFEVYIFQGDALSPYVRLEGCQDSTGCSENVALSLFLLHFFMNCLCSCQQFSKEILCTQDILYVFYTSKGTQIMMILALTYHIQSSGNFLNLQIEQYFSNTLYDVLLKVKKGKYICISS